MPLGLRGDGAVEQGHEPVEALGLKTLTDVPDFIDVRLAGDPVCCADPLKPTVSLDTMRRRR